MNPNQKIIEFDEIKSIPNTEREIFHLGNQDVSLFYEFFSMRYEKFQDRFIVESRYLWEMYREKSPIRILMVKMPDGDMVYCYVKRVDSGYHYLTLMGKPISKSQNEKNEEWVLIELVNYKHIIGFEGIDEEIESLKSRALFDLKTDYIEYYINSKERFDNFLNTSKWKSKYSINKLKEDKDFVFREYERGDYDKNKELVKLWEIGYTSENVTKLQVKSYVDILNSVHNNKLTDIYLIYNLLYKDQLIGCLMFLRVKIKSDTQIAYQEHNLNLSKMFKEATKTENPSENSWSYKLQKLNLAPNFFTNIGSIMFYLTTEDLIKKGIAFSYCQGTKFWNNPESGNYKMRLNDKTIKFSKMTFYKNRLTKNPKLEIVPNE